jgi:hypothetical protein
MPMSPRFQQNKTVEEYRQLAEKCRVHTAIIGVHQVTGSGHSRMNMCAGTLESLWDARSS